MSSLGFLFLFALFIAFPPYNEAKNYLVYVTTSNPALDVIQGFFNNASTANPKCFGDSAIVFTRPPTLPDYTTQSYANSIYKTFTITNDSEVAFIIGDNYPFDNRYFANSLNTSLTPISPVRAVYGFSYGVTTNQAILRVMYTKFFQSLDAPAMVYVIEVVNASSPAVGIDGAAHPYSGFAGRVQIFHYGHAETTYSSICMKILNSGIKNIAVLLRAEYAYALIAEAATRNLFHWSYRWIIMDPNIARSIDNPRLQNIYSKNFTFVDITQSPTTLTKDNIIYKDMATVSRCILEYGFNCSSNWNCLSGNTLTGDFAFDPSVPQLAQRLSYNFTIYAGPRKSTGDTILGTITIDNSGNVISSNFTPLPPISITSSATLQRMQTLNPIRVLLMKEPPFVTISEGNSSNNDSTYPIQNSNLSCSGFAVSLFVQAMVTLQVTNYQFFYIPNITYGTSLGNNNYSGAIGLLNQQLYDIALGAFISTENILDGVDFLMPVTQAPISILYKSYTPSFFQNFFSFITPFSWQVWLVIMATNVAYAVLLWIMHLISPNENDFNLYNSIFFTTSTLMQGTVLASPDRVSGRILTCFWWFFNLFLTITYVCSYGSQFTDVRLSVAISSLDDLLMNEKYDYGTIAEAALDYYYANSPLTVEQQINQNMRAETSLPNTVDEAIDRVKNGKYALIWWKYANEYYQAKFCLASGGAFDQNPVRFPMSKGHEYFSLINEAFRLLSDQNVFIQLENAFFPQTDQSCVKDPSWLETAVNVLDYPAFPMLSSNSLGFSKMGGIFIITFLGCTITMIVAIIELIVRVVSQRKERKQLAKASKSRRPYPKDPKSKKGESSV